MFVSSWPEPEAYIATQTIMIPKSSHQCPAVTVHAVRHTVQMYVHLNKVSTLNMPDIDLYWKRGMYAPHLLEYFFKVLMCNK